MRKILYILVGGLINQKRPKPAHSEKQESPKHELNKLKIIPSRQPMSLLHLQKPLAAKYLIQRHSQIQTPMTKINES